MNNAAVNICVQGLVWTYVFVFLGCIPRSGVAEPHGNSMFNFSRNCFPKWLHQFTLPPGFYECSNSSCFLQHLLIQSSGPEVLSCCDFDLQIFLPYDYDFGYALTFLLIVCVSLKKCLFVSFGSFFYWVTFHYSYIYIFES